MKDLLRRMVFGEGCCHVLGLGIIPRMTGTGNLGSLFLDLQADQADGLSGWILAVHDRNRQIVATQWQVWRQGKGEPGAEDGTGPLPGAGSIAGRAPAWAGQPPGSPTPGPPRAGSRARRTAAHRTRSPRAARCQPQRPAAPSGALRQPSHSSTAAWYAESIPDAWAIDGISMFALTVPGPKPQWQGRPLWSGAWLVRSVSTLCGRVQSVF